MDDDEVMAVAEDNWSRFKENLKIPESVPEESRNELYDILRMDFKIAFFIGYNFCEEKYNPSLSFAKTTLRNLFNGGKVKY